MPASRIASRSIDGGEVVDVGRDVVAAGDRGVVERDARDAVQALLEQPVGLALDPAGHVGVGRPAVRRVVLEAAVAGRVVRRRDHDPVRGGRVRPAAAAVVGEDRVRDRRRRRVAAVLVDHDVDAVAREHLDDRAERRLRQRVRVAAEVQRPARALLGSVAAHRRADRDDVGLGERAVERRPAMSRRAERDRRGRGLLAVGREQRIDVDEVGGLGEGPRTIGDRHPLAPADAARRPCHWSKATAIRIRAPMMIWR